MKYTYSAILTPEENKIFAKIPDLPGCVSSGRDLSDAIAQISDAAANWLVVAEDESLRIPPASPQWALPRADNSVFSVVQVDTIEYRAKTDTRAVRKNVSLPAWMAALADKRGINCSQVLQEGLAARLST